MRRLKYKESLGDRLINFFIAITSQPYSILKHIWRQLLVLAAMVGLGQFMFMYYQGLDPLSALLASVSTISTLGLYAPPIQSIPAIEKVLLIVIIIMSVGSAASIVQGVVGSVVKKELWVEGLDLKRIERMEDHTIVVGYSNIGRYVVERLIEMEEKFCVITRSKDAINELRAMNVPAILSDLKSPVSALSEANVQRAKNIVLALESDEENMLFALTAKHMNPRIKVITVNHSEESMQGMKEAGIDIIVPVFRLVGTVLAYSVSGEGLVGTIHAEERFRGRHIFLIKVNKGSKLDGAKASAVPGVALLVIRGEETLNYLTPDFTLQAGDMVMIMADMKEIRRAYELNAA